MHNCCSTANKKAGRNHSKTSQGTKNKPCQFKKHKNNKSKNKPWYFRKNVTSERMCLFFFGFFLIFIKTEKILCGCSIICLFKDCGSLTKHQTRLCSGESCAARHVLTQTHDGAFVLIFNVVFAIH